VYGSWCTVVVVVVVACYCYIFPLFLRSGSLLPTSYGLVVAERMKYMVTGILCPLSMMTLESNYAKVKHMYFIVLSSLIIYLLPFYFMHFNLKLSLFSTSVV
jgi:hypothetical protein